MRTLITGASGSGTSTLARSVAGRLGIVDDYFWLPTSPPFAGKREPQAATLTPSVRSGEGSIEISVRDDGCGGCVDPVACNRCGNVRERLARNSRSRARSRVRVCVSCSRFEKKSSRQDARNAKEYMFGDQNFSLASLA